MTHDEAVNLRRFKNLCNCGGFAWSMNGRDKAQPHMHWCAQYEEYGEWRRALDNPPKESSSVPASC